LTRKAANGALFVSGPQTAVIRGHSRAVSDVRTRFARLLRIRPDQAGLTPLLTPSRARRASTMPTRVATSLLNGQEGVDGSSPSEGFFGCASAKLGHFGE
jgi:hypothetical protein